MVKTLVLSDLHLGAWTGDALLSQVLPRERLAPWLEEADELVLNGDVFDFLFSTVEHAFAEAEPFFELVADRMRGKRVVFLAGNHDHHIAVRDLRSAVEIQVASGEDGDALARRYREEHRGFLQRYLDRKLAGLETEIVYPSYRCGDVLICHGHYLDAHLTGSLANRLQRRATWSVAGGHPSDELTIGDYESVIVPLTELLFTVAQMPRGTAAQMTFHAQLESIGRVLGLVGRAQRGVRRARSLIQSGSRQNGHGAAADPLQPCSPLADVPLQLAAYGQVIRNLGWDRLARKMVFSHTHQPLDGARDEACGDVRFWNTGSWIYAPPAGRGADLATYIERAWPGTAIVIDSAEPEPRLVHCLAAGTP